MSKSHVTRFSDSSFYDERCILCGATDETGNHSLQGSCPVGHVYVANGHDTHSKDDRIVRCKTCGVEGDEALKLQCTPVEQPKTDTEIICDHLRGTMEVRHTPRQGWQDKVANDLVDQEIKIAATEVIEPKIVDEAITCDLIVKLDQGTHDETVVTILTKDDNWKPIEVEEPYAVEDLRVIVRPTPGEVKVCQKEAVFEVTGDVSAYFEHQKAFFEIVGKAPNELLQLLKFMKVDVVEDSSRSFNSSTVEANTPYGKVYGPSDALDYVAELVAEDTIRKEIGPHLTVTQRGFVPDLKSLLNAYSMENGSDTHDFVLAEYLMGCLTAFDRAVSERTRLRAGGPFDSGAATSPGADDRIGMVQDGVVYYPDPEAHH